MYLVPIVIIIAVFGYLFWMKKSGALGSFQQNYVDAEVEASNRFDFYFGEFKEDENTFRPIVKIIGGDFDAIAKCKQPQGFAGAIADTAKSMATGVVVENTNQHLLVLQKERLHYLEYNTNSRSASQKQSFGRDSITSLELGQGKVTDNMKQTMSFELRDGGKSGDVVKNSDMKKLTFECEGNSYEFFVYDAVGFGDGFVVENPVGGMAMNQSVDDIVRGMLLPQKLAKVFFGKIIQF